MKLFYRIAFALLFILNLNGAVSGQDLKINEIMSANKTILYDEDGDTPDWFEIINVGGSGVNLKDYYLSENADNLFKWQLPDMVLEPNKTLLVYASGKDRLQIPAFWNTIVDVKQSWKYFIPSSEPSSTWKSFNYTETGWLEGPSGIGFGDNDDNTEINTGIISVFMRKKFSVSNLENVESLWMHMDYDDGFVAYINGTEVCRASMGAAGTTISYNTQATSHEAQMYYGGSPEGFNISSFIHLLNENENILAIQVHNTNQSSSDLSAIPFLTVGYSSQVANATVSEYFEMPTLYPHSNFKLSSSGETLIITNKDGMVSDSINYGIIPSNYSFGRDLNNFENWGYFTLPTPGQLNDSEIANDIVKGEVKFSLSEMFLKSPVYLSLSGALPDEEIRYTENGDEPTVASSKFQYGISIDKNKVIRARIFKKGAIPGKISTRTYIFDAKPTLPVVAVTTANENLWDNETGIYVLGDSYENQNPYFGANFWEDWEKPASVEMTGTDGKQIFSLNCGIKIFGAWSRAHPQKSLSVFFRNDYGDPVLEDVSLFKSKPHLTSFKSLVLRNSGNDYGYTRFRDGFMTDLVKDMDTDIAAFEPVILYLNGEYWGEINLREKINEDYLENNHGVKAASMDLLEADAVVLEGTNAEYLELIDFINNNSLVSNAGYEYVEGQINVSNFIDYQLSQIYFNNRDWPGNNIKYWRPEAEDGKWRWILYDTDFGFGIYNSNDFTLNTISFALEPNGPGWPNPPWSTLLLRKLITNSTFKNRFINRFADMLNTTFVAESVVAKIDSIALILQPEIVPHYKRWGTPGYGTWENAVQNMKTFADNRVSFVQTHIKDVFTRAGIFELTLSNYPADAGKIKINSIEITGDSWKGKYFENVPVALSASSFRGHKFHHWEVNGVTVLDVTLTLNLKKATSVKAVYEDKVDDGNSIVFNEINYNSQVENDAGDWVELYNWGRVDLDISGWIFKDDDDSHQFVFPENTILKSNGYLVLARNGANFNIIHPAVPNYIGDFDFGLGSTGDAVRLFDATGILVDSVTFTSESPWPVEPNGNGQTLELRQYINDNEHAESWKPSLVVLGTPGSENSITTGARELAGNMLEKQLKIYPNPFSAETTLKIENNGFDPIRIFIYSIDGRLVRNETIAINEYIWRGDNQNGQKLQPGVYICKVQSGNQMFTEKVILGN